MRNSKTPNYGYKVCYREEGAKEYVRYFLTHTRKQAFNAMRSYIRYPPTARDGDRELVNPKWKVPYRKKKPNAVYGESVRFSGHSLSHRRRTR